MIKSQFKVPDGSYLLSHSVGLMPNSTPTYFEDHFLAPWKNTPHQVWDTWLKDIDNFRKSLSQLLGGTYTSFCPQTNLSSGLVKLLYGLPFRKTQPHVLLTEAAFPSLAYVFSKAGSKCQFIQHDQGVQNLDLWEKALRDDVDMVLITHVHSNTGERLPVQEIIDIAKSLNVITIVDIAQSAGILPISIEKWDADFVIGSCVKWLCGGPGAGFLWVNPNIINQCKPVDVGWFSHENPFEFDIYEFRYADDALRFWGGTPSVAPYVIANNSITELCEYGIEKINKHNQKLTQLWIDALDERWLNDLLEPNQRGGTIILKLDDKCDDLSAKLNTENIHHDIRDRSIRLSPHIYNTEDDVKKVIDCLR